VKICTTAVGALFDFHVNAACKTSLVKGLVFRLPVTGLRPPVGDTDTSEECRKASLSSSLEE